MLKWRIIVLGYYLLDLIVLIIQFNLEFGTIHLKEQFSWYNNICEHDKTYIKTYVVLWRLYFEKIVLYQEFQFASNV